MEDQTPCTSSAADNSAFHLIEIEDDFPEPPVPPEKENLVQPLVDSDTSKEQEATNVSLTRSEDENAVSEDEIHAESTLNSAGVRHLQSSRERIRQIPPHLVGLKSLK